MLGMHPCGRLRRRAHTEQRCAAMLALLCRIEFPINPLYDTNAWQSAPQLVSSSARPWLSLNPAPVCHVMPANLLLHICCCAASPQSLHTTPELPTWQCADGSNQKPYRVYRYAGCAWLLAPLASMPAAPAALPHVAQLRSL